MGVTGTLSKNLKGLGKTRLQVSHGTILTITALALILFIAFTIRILPLRWEIPLGTVGLNEFDPYYQFSLTEKMVTDGLLSSFWPNPWVNNQHWHPHGLDMSTALVSLPMTSAALYSIVSAFGLNIDLMTFCAFMAPLLGAFSVFIMYLIGKDVGGKTVGLLSALILALMPSYVQRTALGFFDTEAIGIVALLLFIFMFLRAIDIKRSLRSMVLYSLGAAGSLAYFILGWGAAYFAVSLTALFVVALLLLKRYNQRLLFSYSITFGLGLFISIAFPAITPEYLFTGPVLPVAAVFALLCIAEVFTAKIDVQAKKMIAGIFVVAIVVGFAAIALFGNITDIAGKFISVVNPFARSGQPLIESVAEHRISGWGSLYFEMGIGILFFLMGLFFAIKNPTNRNVFLILFGLTTLYFAGSMVRLLVLLAPAFALLASVGVVGLIKPFNALLRETGTSMASKSKRRMPRVGKEYGAIAILLVFSLLFMSFAFSPQTGGQPRVYGSSYQPLIVTASSLPITPAEPVPYWLNMLSYTRENLQSDTIVSSWWDYGYWLSYIGNVTTLCDNSTHNHTQIENVAYSFMANETQSLKMLEKYEAEYVLVFVTLQMGITQDQTQYFVQFGGFGDEGKWTWMAKISGAAQDRFIESGYMTNEYSWTNETDFGNYTTDNARTKWTWNELGLESTLYKLMSTGMEQWADRWGVLIDEEAVNPEYFTPAYIAGLEIDPNTGAQKYGGLIPLICLYEINWDAYYEDIGQ